MKKAPPSPRSRVAASETTSRVVSPPSRPPPHHLSLSASETSFPASPPLQPPHLLPSTLGTGKSKLSRKQRMRKKKEALAAKIWERSENVEAFEAANLEKSDNAAAVEAADSEKLFAAAHDKYCKSLEDRGFICHTQGLQASIYPKLVPRFPRQRETLSLEGGFDQTPTLKKILAYYVDDYVPYAHHIVSEYLRPDSKVRLKLKDIYSRISSSVVAVSSFHGVERKLDCSGFIVNWSSADNEGTILTSAKVLCSPVNSSYEFHVVVRMADGTLFLAEEDHVDFYHNIVTLKVKSNVKLNVLDLTADVVGRMRVTGLAERVVALGRSFYGYSFLDYFGELDQDYPTFGCDELVRSSCYASEICEGGPLISDTGDVVGITFIGNGVCAHVLPAHIIRSCLDKWRSLGTATISRPWFGFSVIDLKQVHFQMCEKLNLPHRESCVLVNKVFEGSLAQKKNNVRSYDLIASLNGSPIVSVHQYSDLLSQGVTNSPDSSRPFVVYIDALDRSKEVCVLAEYLSIDDLRFYDCWHQLEDKEWSREKYGSQKNPKKNPKHLLAAESIEGDMIC